MALEEDAIKTRDQSGNQMPVLLKKSIHGAHPFFGSFLVERILKGVRRFSIEILARPCRV
jgi:hypothetical protein